MVEKPRSVGCYEETMSRDRCEGGLSKDEALGTRK